MKNITNFRLFLSTLLFFFLSTSMVWADVCDAWLTDGVGGGFYASKYRILCPMTLPTGGFVVNIQEPVSGTPAIYFGDMGTITYCSLGAGNYTVRGTGLYLHLSAFVNQYTEVTITSGGNNYTFTVEYKYGTSGGGVSCDTKHFYYVKIGGTAYTNVYMWNSSNTSEKNANWPGVAMSTTVPELSILGASIYEISYEGANYDKVIFNDGTNQTSDLNIENCKFYMDGTWYNSIEDVEAQMIFYVNINNWNGVRVHYWNGGTTWPGNAMTKTNTTTSQDHDVYFYYNIGSSAYCKFNEATNDSHQSPTDWGAEKGNYMNERTTYCYGWMASYNELRGSFNSWTAGENIFDWNDKSSTIQTTKQTLTAGNHTFKIWGKGGKWNSANSTMTSANCTNWDFKLSNSEGNCTITADVPGDYIFNYDFAENRLSVIYPPYMLTASYVSSTANTITLAVTSTRGTHYHVVDATHGINLDLTPTEGQIVVTGLTANTAYTFTITALDGNDTESANNISITAATTPNVNAMPSGFDDCQITAVHTSGDEYSPIGMNLANWSYAAGGAAYTDGSNKKAYKVNTNATYYAGLYFGSAWTSTPTTLCDASNATKLHVEFFSPTTETFNFDVLSYYNSANHDGTAQSVTATAGVWQVKDFDLSLFGGEITGHKDVLSGFKIDYGSDNTNKELYIANVYFYKDDAPCSVNANREDLDECRVLAVWGTTKYTPIGVTGYNDWGGGSGAVETIDSKDVVHITGSNYMAVRHADKDVRNYTHLHLDIWMAEANNINLKLLCYSDHFEDGSTYAITTTARVWKSLDIPLSAFNQGANLQKAVGIYPVDLAGKDIYLANAYYYNNDATKPVVTSATNSGISGTDLTLTLTATYKEAALNTFQITNTTTGDVYDCTADGSNHVVIPNIDYCSAYTLNIQAIYNYCILSDATVMNIASREPTGVDLTRLDGVTATASHYPGGWEPAKAIDDDLNSYWASSTPNPSGEWLNIDLTQTWTISTINVGWNNVEAKNLYIEGSNDGVNYYILKHVKATPSYSVQQNPIVYESYSLESHIRVRHVRLRAVGLSAEMAIRDVQIFGACNEDYARPVMTMAELDKVVVVSAEAKADIDVAAYDDVTLPQNIQYNVEFIAGGLANRTNLTATDGVLELTGLTQGTTYTIRIYAVDESGNVSENYKELTFTVHINLYYLTSDGTGAGGVWEGALGNETSAAARRFSSTAEEGIYHFTIAIPNDNIQYRLYYSEDGSITYNAAYWSNSDNQVVGAHSGETNEVYAKDKNHFVSIFDELKVYGAAVGAATEGAALTMTYNGDHTFSWEGDVASGTNAFRIIVNNNHSTITDNSRSRIMDAAENWNNSSSWTRAKLTFDMTTWTWTWEEAADPTLCTANGGQGSGMTIAGDEKATTFTDGYTLSVKKGAPGHLLVSASIKESVSTSGAVYLNFHSQSGSRAIYAEECIIGASEPTMSVVNKDVTIPAAVASDPVLALSVKFEINGTGITGEVRFTDIMYYDLEDGGCIDPTTDYFDIYHWDDAPIDARTSFGGGNIVLPIRYFRHFDNNWTTITVPFEVEKVVVYDEDDKVEYPLFPRFYNGTQDVEGYYYLKTFDNWSTTSVALKDFQASWKQLTVATDKDGMTAGGDIDDAEEVWLSENVKPEKNTPYSIKFPYADYYATNWVIFYGSAFQTIASDFNGGTSIKLTDDTYDYNQVKLQCNNTMHPSPVLTNIYMIEEGEDLFTRRESQAVPAFEAYVIGTSQVQARFSVLRWSGETTAINSERPSTADEAGEIYTVSGMRLATFANQEQMERYLNTFASGVYVVRVGTRINKVIVH